MPPSVVRQIPIRLLRFPVDIGESDAAQAAHCIFIVVQGGPTQAAIKGAQDSAFISHCNSGSGVNERDGPKRSLRIGGLNAPGVSAVGCAQDRTVVPEHNSGVGVDEGNRPQVGGRATRQRFPVCASVSCTGVFQDDAETIEVGKSFGSRKDL